MGKKVFVDLTHPFSAEIPRWPYFDKPFIEGKHSMAKGGVLTQYVGCTMHTGTHCDAPRHVMEFEFDGRRARYTHEMPIDAYTGDAVCLEIHVGRWELIMPEHLEDACKRANIKPSELEGMVVCLNTGMHRLFDDSKEYYHYSCGTGIDAGRWFVEHKVKCVAMDMQALDHPLHTAMGNNGMTRMNLLGASGKPITEEYKELFGEEAYAEFDKFEYITVDKVFFPFVQYIVAHTCIPPAPDVIFQPSLESLPVAKSTVPLKAAVPRPSFQVLPSSRFFPIFFVISPPIFPVICAVKLQLSFPLTVSTSVSREVERKAIFIPS